MTYFGPPARSTWVHPGLAALWRIVMEGPEAEASVAWQLISVAVQGASMRTTTMVANTRACQPLRRTRIAPKRCAPTLARGQAEVALRLVGRSWGLYVLAGDRLLCSNGASIGLGTDPTNVRSFSRAC